MATISSPGIGSGLDVNNIVSQLVALEKQPLKNLQLKATTVQAQVSAFAQLKSQVSALTDVANRISVASAWSARTASSSNTAAATVTVTSVASATSFSLDVDALAKQQSIASATEAPGTLLGAGTLTIRLGKWNAGGTSFDGTGTSDVPVTVLATDKLADIAGKINSAEAGVVATVFNDGTSERLLLRSRDTGELKGFRVQVTEGATVDPTVAPNNDNVGLSRLAFDPATGAFGMASAGMDVQYGQDAKARINGLAVSSASNTLSNNIPGLTISLVQTTTSNYGLPGEVKAPVTIGITNDVTLAVRNVQDFVTAYNALNKNLVELTKYDAATKTGSLFQGDSSVVGMQNILRNMLGSVSVGSAYQRLSDVGVQMQLDGTLTFDTSKLSTAANNGDALQRLFTTDNSNALTNGFGLKFKVFGQGVLASSGAVASKAKALQSALDVNNREQTKVNDRAALVEARLRKQYTALDGQLGRLNSLSAYVSQQVTLWNRSTG